MKVSVIVSTYSVERFSDVIRCLNSIGKQTLKFLYSESKDQKIFSRLNDIFAFAIFSPLTKFPIINYHQDVSVICGVLGKSRDRSKHTTI
jgi:hypothetical protein